MKHVTLMHLYFSPLGIAVSDHFCFLEMKINERTMSSLCSL